MSHDERLANKLVSELAITQGNALGRANELAREATATGLELGLDVETVVATTMKIYNEYIVPVDIPAIPNFAEPMFDQLLGKAIEFLIRGAFKALGR